MRLIGIILVVCATVFYIAAQVYTIKLLGQFVRAHDEIYKDSRDEK